MSGRLSADDDFFDELIGDIGNISNVMSDADAMTNDEQLLLEMQELLSWSFNMPTVIKDILNHVIRSFELLWKYARRIKLAYTTSSL